LVPQAGAEERLSDEREKLLRLHNDEAVPLDLLQKDQDRIMRELEDVRDQLAAVSCALTAIEKKLNRALELARDCHVAYESATPEIRRLFNQAFFKK
jgi:site-specific DNA recombinase